MSKSIPIQSFRINEEGIARLFGELEAKVMESIWVLQDQEPTVQAVCDYLGPGHNYKTVMTVLNRLVEKGALTRQRRSRAFVYLPKQSRDAFIGRVSRLVFGGLVRDFGSLAVAQFVETLDEVDPAQLDELERLVRQRREALTADSEGSDDGK